VLAIGQEDAVFLVTYQEKWVSRFYKAAFGGVAFRLEKIERETATKVISPKVVET
jgi:hypothetical protein